MSDLPAPLLPPEVDLRDFPYMPLVIQRLFNSEFHAKATDAEWRAGVTLWLKAFHLPGAALPDDDVQLARLAELGRDVKAWAKVKKMALHGWIKCSDGHLYHKVVAEVAQQSWIRKLELQEERAKDRERLKQWRERRKQKRSETTHETRDETPDETEDETPVKRVSKRGQNTDETSIKEREVKGRDSKLALSSDTPNSDRSDSGTEIQKNECLRITQRCLGSPNYSDPTNRKAFADNAVVKVLAAKTNTADAWMTVMSARDPSDPDHAKNRRECEQIARSISVVWEPDPMRASA